jgi:uncharacterized phage protein gp47/JayE
MEIVEHFPPEEDLWNITIYLEDGSGGMIPDAIEQVKAIIDGNGTEQDKGYRAPGINIRYLPPTQVPIRLSVEITTRGVEAARAVMDARNAIREYINSLGIGQAVIHSDLVKVLRRINYAIDARVPFPEDKIPMGKSQIARYLDCDVAVIVQ